MAVTIEKPGVNEVKLNIEVEPAVSSFEYEKACRKIAKIVKVPGFRPGRAPRNILEKYAGLAAIQREVIESVLPTIIEKTAEENNFDLISAPSIESYEFADDNTIKAAVRLELRPEVKLPNYADIAVEVEEFKQAPDALEKELQHTAERYAEYKDAGDRAAAKTDIVNIDFAGYSEGEEIKGGSAKNYNLDLAHSNFIPGFAEQIEGHKTGGEFKINVKFPDEYHDEKLKGKAAEFNIKINSIKEKILPEINDDFAKKVNPKFSTLEDLKNDIRTFLDDTEKTENNRRVSKKIFDTIIEKTEIELSDSMINREIQALMSEFRERINMQGGNYDAMLEKEGHEKVYAQMKEEAVKRIKTSLITGKIAQDEKLAATAEDIQKQINGLGAVYHVQPAAIAQEIQKNPAALNPIVQQILIGKTAEFLAGKVKINYVNK